MGGHELGSVFCKRTFISLTRKQGSNQPFNSRNATKACTSSLKNINAAQTNFSYLHERGSSEGDAVRKGILKILKKYWSMARPILHS